MSLLIFFPLSFSASFLFTKFVAMTTVSIVLHRTSQRLISEVLSSLAADTVNHIYIVDNSPDDSLGSLFNGLEGITYLHVANNGFGAAHNIAIRMAAKAGSSHHLVLNPDVRWSGKILPSLINVMNRAEKNMANSAP